MRLLDGGARRVLRLDGADPAARWADLTRPEDLAAMGRLAGAVLGDIGARRLWALAWKLATRLAYGAVYKPFGHYVAESDHLAALVGGQRLAPADMAALQRLYTLAHAGCSTVMAWDAARQRMVHFRSLDWPSAEAIADATRVVVGQDGGRTVFTAAALAGMTGLLSAVKPGFSVALNFAPWRGPSFSLNSDPTFLVRQLMEAPVTTFAEACHVVARWRPAAPVFVSLCGVARGEARVFEFGAAWHPRRRGHVRAMVADAPLVQTNHYAPSSPFARHRRPQAPPHAWGDPAWDGHAILATSEARQRLVDEGVRRHADQDDLTETLCGLFSRRPVWNHETAQWVEMLPASGEMRVWVRDGHAGIGGM